MRPQQQHIGLEGRRKSQEDMVDHHHQLYSDYYGKTRSLRYPSARAKQPVRTCCCGAGQGGGQQSQEQARSSHNIPAVDSVEILPIFHKLLEDKRACCQGQPSKGGHLNHTAMNHENSLIASAAAAAAVAAAAAESSRFNAARSCPDMSVRCDIVEYL